MRSGGEFFARPTGPNHRRYEALRGYLYEGLPTEVAAARAGYSPATLRSAVRDFRAGKTGFFLNPRPGPTRAPAKNAARHSVIELRRAGHSAKEISELLAGTPTPLNRTGVAEILAEAGFPRLPVRPPAERSAPYRDTPAGPRSSTSRHYLTGPRRRWPGCCWPSLNWSPWTCPRWSPRPATPARR